MQQCDVRENGRDRHGTGGIVTSATAGSRLGSCRVDELEHAPRHGRQIVEARERGEAASEHDPGFIAALKHPELGVARIVDRLAVTLDQYPPYHLVVP